ncbi:HD-GYP domain-containing protein [Agrobacterium salinitolerans]|uniref:HD-GYP domain-containing protein n=1 Tax=Agrobacterium salinitolerans TaxID=1183413 RepID=A0ABY3BVS6_9HYPH|nr:MULTISPECIES: HD-GYP domain-containing protein [Agrobacterium]MBA4775569.1 HD-GYP domain-containing protein [Hyphomicrobiales bacterium]MCZ7851457.1 HD-GYP domain-containing protein [Agrobacterium salinitolerans]MCZ7856799.1 HD-GYP domain-containing protein [Agrobacterium salinitolerans]MCZ7890135.1 HD-GYP domain-containing protein [Agrobacterium salinitolerans]MCZ7976626.1 HD-GYP domain-containing protein [Agrobacterium salinitolerans]
MLKRISTRQLTVGMFIEAVEGTASNRQIMQRHRFLLRHEDGVRQLKASGAESIVINTARGNDVEARSGVGGPTSMKTDSSPETTAVISHAVRLAADAVAETFAVAETGGGVSLTSMATAAGRISDAVQSNPAIFIGVTRLKSKDETTFVHSVSVSGLMILFGNYLGLDRATVNLLGISGLLHDIGKVEIPSSILNKAEGLSASERQIINLHPAFGRDILSRNAQMPEMLLDVCFNHHERMDGGGYPSGRAGSQISLYARIAAICDVYDAITSVRPYKKPWTANDALTWMLRREGHFDMQLLKKFALCISASLPRG